MTAATGERPSHSKGEAVPRLALDGERSARRAFQRRVLRATLIVDGVVLLTLITVVLAWKLRAVLLLVLISLFFTLLLHPLVSFVERRNVRRALATAVVFVVGVGVLATLLFVIINPLVSAAEHLAHELPKTIRQVQHGKGALGGFVKRFHLQKYVTSKHGGVQMLVAKLSKPAISVGKGVLSGVVAIITVAFLTFFLLIHAPNIYGGVLRWMQPERAARVRSIVSDVERSVVGYMAGDLATSLVAGVIVTLTLVFTGVPYPIVLGIWVAIVDFLPLVGGLLAGVPTVVIAALHSIPAGIITLVVFLAYQEFENHVLYPVIMSRTVRLNSLAILVAVLFGASLGDVIGSVFGAFVGALLAVPTGSAVQVIARDLWRHRTGASLLAPLAEATPAPGTDPLDTGPLPTSSGEERAGGSRPTSPDRPATFD
jgi:predicted PurR-regulated permease PerM